MLSVFGKPYPFISNSGKRVINVVAAAAFVFLFLYIFQPFGLHLMENIASVTFQFGLVTFCAGMLIYVWLPSHFTQYFHEDRWTTGREIIFNFILAGAIGISNLILSTFYGLESSVTAMLILFTIGMLVVLPAVILTVLINQSRLMKKNLRAAKMLSKTLSHKVRLPASGAAVTIQTKNRTDNFTVDPSHIYLIRGVQSDIEITYSNGLVMNKKKVDTTLRSAHNDLKSLSQFYRCHRTCVVNLEKVESVTGNAQGYRLLLLHSTESIPVSRVLNKEITLRLKS